MKVSKDSPNDIISTSPISSATPGITMINKFGVHIYETDFGMLLSATTILKYSKDPKDNVGLQKWRDSTTKRYGGEGAANYIMQNAGRIGTATHKLNEKYLEKTLTEKDLYKIDMLVKAHHYNMRLAMDRTTNIKGLELMLYSRKYGIAGTSDVIADFDGVPSVIDYKAKRSPQTRSYLEDYFVQGAMYSEMWYEMYNERIEQLVLIMSNEKTGELQIFIEPLAEHIPKMEKRISMAMENLPSELRDYLNEDRRNRGKPEYKPKQIERLKVF